MARYPAGHKDAVKARIVDEAAQAYREHGLDGIGIQALLKRLGLSHGGFYVHFDSRDALAAAAIQRASDDVDATLLAEHAGKPIDLPRFIQRYLSEPHRDAPGKGCPVAALGAEAPRQSEPVKQAIAGAVKGFLRKIARTAGTPEARSLDDTAIAVGCVLVGALVISRALGADDLSARVLRVGARVARALADGSR